MIVNRTITKNLLLQQAGKKEGGLGGTPRRSRFATLRGKNFCPPANRAEGAAGVGAAPLSCSVKRSKAKHFSIPFRRKRVARQN